MAYKKTNFTNIPRSWTAAHTVFKVNITQGSLWERLFLLCCLPRVLHRGSDPRAEPSPSLIPRTAARGTAGDLGLACPPGKHKYALSEGMWTDTVGFFLVFGCPSSSCFCSAANKGKLSSSGSQAPPLLPVQGHCHSILQTPPSPLPKTSLSFYICPFTSQHRVQTWDECLENIK